MQNVNYRRRHDTQHNDIQHNDTQHNDIQHNDTQHNVITTLGIKTLKRIVLNVIYAECHLC